MHIFEVGLFAKKRTSLTLGQVLMLLAPVIAVNHLLLNANVHTALKMRGFLTPGIKLSFLRMNSGRACLLVTNTSGNQRNLPEPLKHD